MEGKGGKKKTPPKKNTGEKRGRGREGEGEGGGQRVTGEISLLGLPSLHPESIYGHLRHGSLTGDSRNGCGGRSEQPRCSYKGGGGEGEPGVRTGCRSCLPLPAPACPPKPPGTCPPPPTLPRGTAPPRIAPSTQPEHHPDCTKHPGAATKRSLASTPSAPRLPPEHPPGHPAASPGSPPGTPQHPSHHPGHPAASPGSVRAPRSIPSARPEHPSARPKHPPHSP